MSLLFTIIAGLWLTSALGAGDLAAAFIPGLYIAYKIGKFVGATNVWGNIFRF